MSEKAVDNQGDLPPTGKHDAPDVQFVKDARVTCDGNLTHPRIWLHIPEDRGWVECGYCDKRFVLEEGADGH